MSLHADATTYFAPAAPNAPLAGRIAPGMVIGLLALGAVLVGTGLALDRPLLALVGAPQLLFGLMSLVNPVVVELDHREVRVRNPFGMVVQRIPFEYLGELELHGGRLRHRVTRKQAALTWVRGADRAAIEARLATR